MCNPQASHLIFLALVLFLSISKNKKNIGRAQRIFRAVKILSATLMVDNRHYPFVQTHKIYNTKSGPSCKLWMLDDNDVSV